MYSDREQEELSLQLPRSPKGWSALHCSPAPAISSLRNVTHGAFGVVEHVFTCSTLQIRMLDRGRSRAKRKLKSEFHLPALATCM